MLATGRSRLLGLLSGTSRSHALTGLSTLFHATSGQLIFPDALCRCFASKAYKPKGKPNSSKHKKQAIQQQAAVDKAAAQQPLGRQKGNVSRGSNNSSSGGSSSRSGSSSSLMSKSLPQPTRLALPSLTVAAAPLLGRVPPSSSAAAAAAAAMLKARPSTQARKSVAADPTPPGAAELAKQRGSSRPGLRRRVREAAAVGHETSTPELGSSHAAKQDAAAAAADGGAADAAAASVAPAGKQQLRPHENILPWEVVEALPQSCSFSLERLAHGSISTYIEYLRAARMGMPSAFDLGLVREQGREARQHLLQRERLLLMLIQQMHIARTSSRDIAMQQLDQWQQQQQSLPAAAEASSSTRQVQQEVGGMVTGWQPEEDELQELTEQQLQGVAAAARSSGGALLSGVTGEDVSECLVDYFVFKRCMEVMLLQRQYRQALTAKHHQLLQQQSGPQVGTAPPVTLLSHAELADVKLWDAFFDITLQDYIDYLQAAAAGQPSVFTTSSTSIYPQQQQQQKDEHQAQAAAEYQEACESMAAGAAVLSMLPTRLLSRPGQLTGLQLAQLAVLAGEESTEEVVQLFENFYQAKRMAFREVLEELLTAAGTEAAGTMGRF